MTHQAPGHDPEALPEFEQALCRTRPDLPWFGGGTTKHERQARALCCRCPELDPCTLWALDHEETAGIWGGLTVRQRQAMLAARIERPILGPSSPKEPGV